MIPLFYNCANAVLSHYNAAMYSAEPLARFYGAGVNLPCNAIPLHLRSS